MREGISAILSYAYRGSSSRSPVGWHFGSSRISAPEIWMWSKHLAIRCDSQALTDSWLFRFPFCSKTPKFMKKHLLTKVKRFLNPGNICTNDSRPWPTFSASKCFLLSDDALSRCRKLQGRFLSEGYQHSKILSRGGDCSLQLEGEQISCITEDDFISLRFGTGRRRK